MLRIISLLLLPILVFSCATKTEKSATILNWYLNPKQNDTKYLYGTAEGNSLEEATKYALTNAASKIMVTISAQSTLTREENRQSVNEEMRQNVAEQVEKTTFNNFTMTNSTQAGVRFYAEVAIDRADFVKSQQEKSLLLETKLADLTQEIAKSDNPVQKRISLLTAIDLAKQSAAVAQLLNGLGANITIKDKLTRAAKLESALRNMNNKLEFYFAPGANMEVAKLIRNALNQEGIKVMPGAHAGRIAVKIKSSATTSEVYDSLITKIRVDFENNLDGKVIASNSVEVSGSSMTSKRESESAAYDSLDQMIKKDGVMKVLGIVHSVN